jgi:hypothetical protein
MYATQQLPNVSVYLQSLRDVIKDLQRTLFPSQNNQLSVEEQLNALELSPQSGGDKSRKLFNTCFEQVEILGAKIVETGACTMTTSVLFEYIFLGCFLSN